MSSELPLGEGVVPAMLCRVGGKSGKAQTLLGHLMRCLATLIVGKTPEPAVLGLVNRSTGEFEWECSAESAQPLFYPAFTVGLLNGIRQTKEEEFSRK